MSGTRLSRSAAIREWRLTLPCLGGLCLAVAACAQTDADTKPPHHFRYEFKKASKEWDFALEGDGSMQDTGELHGAGAVSIYQKGSASVYQRIPLPSMSIAFGDDKQPIFNSSALYDYQGAVNAGDFNFDGHEDFAVQIGDDGNYGSPTYSFFFFNPATAKFAYGAALSKLIANESLGFPKVYPASQTIMLLDKSGCCFHTQTVYRMQGTTPIPVKRTEESADPDSGKQRVVGKLWRGGRWVPVFHSVTPLPKDQ